MRNVTRKCRACGKRITRGRYCNDGCLARAARRRQRERDKADPDSRYWRAKADALWSLLVRADAGGQCEVCGAEHTQAHHLIPKQVRAYRWELRNGIALCRKHHKFDRQLSAHGGTIGFFIWLREHRADRWAWARDAYRALATPRGVPVPHARDEYERLARIAERAKEKA